MLRDRNLIPLSHQHHTALVLCVLTRRSLGKDSSSENIARLAGRIVYFCEVELANHFAIEEEILFPAVACSLGPNSLIEELILEHCALESLARALASAPTTALLEQWCALLTKHIRCEEGDLFQLVQSRLSSEQLLRLGESIKANALQMCFEKVL